VKSFFFPLLFCFSGVSSRFSAIVRITISTNQFRQTTAVHAKKKWRLHNLLAHFRTMFQIVPGTIAKERTRRQKITKLVQKPFLGVLHVPSLAVKRGNSRILSHFFVNVWFGSIPE
jgi:hypothetical protein